MKHEIIKQRDEFLYKMWEHFKGDYSMEKMSLYLSIPLKTLYRIISRSAAGNKQPKK